MKSYELTYIINPELSFEEAEAKAKEIESLIKNKEGVVLKQTNIGAKTLAYPIKKSASGFFGVFEFEMEPELLKEFKEAIMKDEKIMRQMIVIKKAPKAVKERKPRIKLAEATKLEKQAPKEETSKTTLGKEKEEGKIKLQDIEQKLEELLGE